MNPRAIAGWLAAVLLAAGPCLSLLQAQEVPTEDSPVRCTIRPGVTTEDETRDVYHGTIGTQNIWMALHETEDGQLAGSYFYEKHGKELSLSGCMTEEGRLRLEERVDGQLTGVMLCSRLERDSGGARDGLGNPLDVSGSWMSPDGKRRLPLNLWRRGRLAGMEKNDLDNLQPVPVDWEEFRAPDCHFAFRHPRMDPGTWHSAPVKEDDEDEPFPACRLYGRFPSTPGDYDDRNPRIDIYRGVDKKIVFEKHGFVPFWTTWEVGWMPPDIAEEENAGRLHVTWAEPPWVFWSNYDGNYVKHHESRSEAVIEDGDSVIYFSSPDPGMWVSHFVRGLLAVGPGKPAPLGEFYTYGSGTIHERQEMRSRSHTTWEGTYSFDHEQIYGIEGLPDLHVFVYAHPEREGRLLDLARQGSYDSLVLEREANTEVKGVTPAFEGIDVFPGENEAEIIVRWRHPGQGGLRTVEKYRYTLDGIDAVDRSEFESPGRRMEWRKATNPAEHTAPATRAPESSGEAGFRRVGEVWE